MASVALVVSPSPQVRAQMQACIEHLNSRCRVVHTESAQAVQPLKPDAILALIVLDLDAPQAQGPATVYALAQRFRNAALAVLSEVTDTHSIEGALRAGAWAYIPKSYTPRQMELVLELALGGVGHRPHRHEDASSAEVEPPVPSIGEPPADQGERLTPKQVEVLSHAAAGLSNKQIATRLKIAEGTVKLHMNSIYRKLNVERRGEAIVLAHRMEAIRRQHVEQGQRGGDRVLDWLLPHVGHRRLKQGDVLFRKGDAGHELFYLQRGRVSLDEIGVEIGPGQIFGEIGVFAPGRTRTSTARCLTDAELFCLNSEQVKSIYYLNPQFALHIVTLLAQRLADERMQ